MNAYFEQPAWLFLILAVIPAAGVFLFRYRNLVQSLLPLVAKADYNPARPLTRMVTARFVCFALAWVFLVCAAASPRWGTELVAVRQEGSSVMFVVDISRSMTVADIPPNRLSFASRYAWLLTGQMENTPCGVVLVKGSGVLAVPLTTDHRSVLDLLSSLSPSMLSSPGSGIGQGVRIALESFPRNSTASRTVILFTDGEETSGSLDDAARAVRADGAVLIIVGVGTEAGSDLNMYSGGGEVKMHTAKLRADILKNAVHAAGRGSLYVAGTETGSARRVLEASLPPSGNERKLVYSPKPVYRYFEFLLASLVSIGAAFIAGGLVWRKE